MLGRLLLMLLAASYPLSSSAEAAGYVHTRDFGELGSGEGQFNTPFDVEVRDDEVFVADSHNNRVQVLDLDGNFRRVWGGTGDADGQFRRNRGLSVDPRPGQDWIYVTDAKNDRVQRFTLAGLHLDSWGTIGAGDEEFFRPRGIAVLDDGRIAIGDADNQRVKIYFPDLRLQRIFGAAGSSEGLFRGPFDVAIGPENRIHVADAFNARVQVFAADGSFLFSFGQYGPGDGQFVIPRGLTVAPDGRVFVSDIGDSEHSVDRIQCFTAEGEFLFRLGERGAGPGQFDNVNGLALDAEGRLYAADSFNHRISVWEPVSVDTEVESMSSWRARWREPDHP